MRTRSLAVGPALVVDTSVDSEMEKIGTWMSHHRMASRESQTTRLIGYGGQFVSDLSKHGA